MTTGYKYAAFISYSHKDKAWGERLHRALERYSVPKRIRGMEGRDGPIGPRIFPVFRDRDELPSSSDLNEQIAVALRQSATLIVICSPRAAVSRWVNEEVRLFKALGRSNRILALIIDGVPNASDTLGASPADECFPEALRYRVGTDGALTSERVEPVAADVRPEGDGEENARLKIIAGVLGIGFDRLRQRDLEAQRSRLRRLVAIAGTVAIALTGLLVLSVHFAREAREERNRALRHLGDSYAAEADELAAAGQYDAATRVALMAVRLSEGTSARAVAVLRHAGAGIRLRARFPINVHARSQAALSPDDRLLATGVGSDAHVWDAQTARLQRRLAGHAGVVRSVQFSPDSSRLLTASEDGTARVWDVATGAVAGSVKGSETIYFARFWRNGSAIVTATAGGDIRVWDAQTFRQLAVATREPLGSLQSLDVSGDGRKIVAASNSQIHLFVFHPARGFETHILPLKPFFSGNATLSRDSKFVLTSLFGNEVQFWNAETGDLDPAQLENVVRGAGLSTGGSGSFTPKGEHERLRVIEAMTAAVPQVNGFLSVGVEAAGRSADYGRLAIAQRGRRVELLRWGTIQQIQLLDGVQRLEDTDVWTREGTFDGHLDAIQAIEFSGDGRMLYSSSLDGTVRQWEIRPTPPEVVSIPLHGLASFGFAAGRAFVLDRQRLRSIDLRSMAVTDERAIPSGARRLYPSHRGDRIAYIDPSARIFILDVGSGKMVPMEGVEFFGSEFGSPAWSPDDSVLATTTFGAAAVKLSDSRTGRLLGQVRRLGMEVVKEVAFSRDGSKLVLRDIYGTIRVHRSDGTLLFTLGGEAVRHNAFVVSPTADEIATAGDNPELRIWDLQAGLLKSTFSGHGRSVGGDSVLGVGFSYDGRFLYSYSRDKTARIWDAATGANLLTVHLTEPDVACLSFLPGAWEVAIKDLDGTRVFDIETGVVTMVLPDTIGCPHFAADRALAIGHTFRPERAVLWDISRLTRSVDELVAAACSQGGLPATARTFTKFEADRDPMIRNLRLDSKGREIDVCTGRAAASDPGRQPASRGGKASSR